MQQQYGDGQAHGSTVLLCFSQFTSIAMTDFLLALSSPSLASASS
jgi:hypothetical protein